MSSLTKALMILMVIALAMVAGLNTYTVMHFMQSPVSASAIVTNTPVRYGSDVIVKYTTDRQALCKTDFDLFVMRMPEQMLVLSERRPGGMFPLGKSTGYLRLSTVADVLIPPAQYVARFFIHSDCGDRLHTFEVPDIPFEVIH